MTTDSLYLQEADNIPEFISWPGRSLVLIINLLMAVVVLEPRDLCASGGLSSAVLA